MPYSARVSILVEIAEKADVSVEGVVRVLTREPVSEAVKERVLAVLDDLTPEQTRAVQRFALAALHDVLLQSGDAIELSAAPAADEDPPVLPAAATGSDAALVQLGSVLGELAEAVRDLRRETDAERRERVDDLAVLIDLITTGWQGLDARLGRIEKQVSRLEAGRREPLVIAPARVVPTAVEPPPAAAAPVETAEHGGRGKLPIVATLTLVGATIVTLAVLQLASGGPDVSRLVSPRESPTTGEASSTTSAPSSTPAETRPAATTARPPAQRPTTPATTSDVLGTTSGATTRAEASRRDDLAEDRHHAAGSDHPPGSDRREPARLPADAQLGVGAGQERCLLRRRLHARREGLLRRVADRAAADAAELARLPAGRLSVGRAARVRRPHGEEPRPAGRGLAVHGVVTRVRV